ncbi:MAG: GNAT family N-acetyltransferase [Vicinamibacterales bacterium]
MATEVRRLTAKDVELARRTFQTMSAVFETDGVPLGDDYLRALLGRPDFWAFAAVDGDAVLGGITAHTLPMTRSESAEVFIYDLAVVPERQRQGIGRRLVATLRDAAAAEGIAVTFVPADNDDTHALDFYQAIGGTPAPVTIFTFGDGD